MEDLIKEIKYELTRTLKHVFYVLLVLCWFLLWYVVFSLLTGLWNPSLWTRDTTNDYAIISVLTGLVYGGYRIATY